MHRMIKNEKYEFTTQDINNYILNHFGISDVDITQSSYYIKDKNMFEHLGHGGPYSAQSLISSVYDADTNIQTVVIEYFADMAYMLSGRTMKYTLEKNPDNSFKLLSTEIIKNNGIKLFGQGE